MGAILHMLLWAFMVLGGIALLILLAIGWSIFLIVREAGKRDP